MLIGRRNMANILTFSRKSQTPLKTSYYYSEPIILKCEFFGFDRLALENEICSNFENSDNVDVNTKLNGKQGCQACNVLLFFEDKEEPQP